MIILISLRSLLFPSLFPQDRVYADKDNRGLKIDKSRMRDLNAWKPLIREYSKRHYGEDTWKLRPRVVVLHYTAMPDFPWNLVKSQSFGGEKPGLAVHYVVSGKKIWQILPDNVRSRGCWGMNHRAVNIEMDALNAQDLSQKTSTLDTCARLVRILMKKYGIPLNKVYSHQLVAKMNKNLTPEVLDKVDGTPYSKQDPGEQNMNYIKNKIREMENEGDD